MLKMSGGVPGFPHGQREEEAVWDGGKSLFCHHHRASFHPILPLQVLYLVGFPILVVMIAVGGLKAAAPGEENPTCPAEPNMPWFLITGGAGISLLLIIRIVLNKLTNYVKNNQECCDQVSPGYLTTKLYHTIPRLLAVSASLAVI